MSYQVILPRSPQKELDRLPDEIAERILRALEDLKTQPRPPGCKKSCAVKMPGVSALVTIA